MNIAYGTYETGRCNDFASQLELQHVSSNYPVLEIHVAGKDLKKLDVGSPSDPMVVMPFNMETGLKLIEPKPFPIMLIHNL